MSTKPRLSALEPRFFFDFWSGENPDAKHTKITTNTRTTILSQTTLQLRKLRTERKILEEVTIKRDQIKISHPLLLHRQLLTLLQTSLLQQHHEYFCDASTRSSSVTDDEEIKLLQQQVPITDVAADSRIVEPPWVSHSE